MILTCVEPCTLLDYVNETDGHRDTSYVSLTAPVVVRLDVFIDEALVESVYVGPGCSHTWWTPAGGKFFPVKEAPQGLPPGARLRIVASGECALRMDWT